MSVSLIVGLVAALLSTILVNLAYVREQGAVSGLPDLSLRHPLRSARLLLSSRAWLAGFGMEGGGFGLYVLALALAPLALVQSVGAGGLGVLAVATSRLTHRRLGRHEVVGSAIAVAGLALLAVSLSGGDVRGARLLFAIPLIGGYLIGTSLLQIGYQSGTALTVAGLGTLATNAVPIAAGTVVLDERVPSGALGVVRVLAFTAVTAGAILLARPETDRRARAPEA